MDKAISFDLHDTILVLRFGGKFKNIKFVRAILYFLSNFKSFVFTYTYFCQRNEAVIELMKNLKKEGNKVIVLKLERTPKFNNFWLNLRRCFVC